MSWTLLVDLDEVFTDFAGAAARLHGLTKDPRPTGVWDMGQILELDQDAFWQPIHDAGAAFWANLPVQPWAQDLRALLNSLGQEWYVVTAPSRCPSSYVGKIEWIHNFFHNGFDRFIITPHKHLLAGPKHCLIDDREESVTKFRKHGGYGVVFPSIGNRLFPLRFDPLKYVETELRRITSY